MEYCQIFSTRCYDMGASSSHHGLKATASLRCDTSPLAGTAGGGPRWPHVTNSTKNVVKIQKETQGKYKESIRKV